MSIIVPSADRRARRAGWHEGPADRGPGRPKSLKEKGQRGCAARDAPSPRDGPDAKSRKPPPAGRGFREIRIAAGLLVAAQQTAERPEDRALFDLAAALRRRREHAAGKSRERQALQPDATGAGQAH
jgi:hypothetical protein